MSARPGFRPRRSPISLVITFPGGGETLRFDADPVALPDTFDGIAERFEAACRRSGIRWVSGIIRDGDLEIRAAIDTHADLVIAAAPQEQGERTCAAFPPIG